MYNNFGCETYRRGYSRKLHENARIILNHALNLFVCCELDPCDSGLGPKGGIL